MLLPYGESIVTNLPIQNRLLQRLSAADLSLLQLSPMPLPLRTRLEMPGEPVEYVYFIESGVASVVLDNVAGKEVEVGLIGNEGLTGTGLALGDRTSVLETYMQVEGSAFQVGAERFSASIAESRTLRDLVLRYSRYFGIQAAATASANGRANLEARLARWLLMVSDRTGPTFQITHEFISIMLGVRRAGVTLAIAALEGDRLIRASRGSITILDREGLIDEADGSYGLPEREYDRLLKP
jgi:CRP-like cAMP-binding protein